MWFNFCFSFKNESKAHKNQFIDEKKQIFTTMKYTVVTIVVQDGLACEPDSTPMINSS